MWVLVLALGMTTGTSVNFNRPQWQNKGIGGNWFQEPKRQKFKEIERLSDWLNITMLVRKNREQSWKKYEK